MIYNKEQIEKLIDKTYNNISNNYKKEDGGYYPVYAVIDDHSTDFTMVEILAIMIDDFMLGPNKGNIHLQLISVEDVNDDLIIAKIQSLTNKASWGGLLHNIEYRINESPLIMSSVPVLSYHEYSKTKTVKEVIIECTRRK